MQLPDLSWWTKNLIIKSGSLKFFQNSRDFEKNIIVFGSGRSGTTWLGEMLSDLYGGVMIDEPLKLSSSRRVQKAGFTGWCTYLDPQNQNQKFIKIFDQFFRGYAINPNMYKGKIDDFNFNSVWVWKLIRGHLLMPWLNENYHLTKQIFIIRNPFDVISSQLTHNGWVSRGLLADKEIIMPVHGDSRIFYNKYKDLFKKSRFGEERLAIHWCIQNEFILKHKYNNLKWIQIRYEDLLRNPLDELTKIVNALGLTIHRPINSLNIEKISYSGRSNDTLTFTGDEKRRIEDIISQFDLLSSLYL